MFAATPRETPAAFPFGFFESDSPMSTVLVLNSSAGGADSVSRLLVADAVAALTAADPAATIISRDLAADPVPHLSPEAVVGVRTGDTSTPERATAVALSDALIAELKAADVVVIGSPMYNFGITSTLKSWFDYVLRAGVTFRYTEKGPEGLVGTKKAIVVESRGGVYSEGPFKVADSQEPHLRTMLGFIGITDVTFVHAERIGFGPEARAKSIADARTLIGSLAA